MARFHPLPVAAVDRLTDDSVALTFTVPPELREEYRHAAGQHLALRRTADGREIRRTYSICSPQPTPKDLPNCRAAESLGRAGPSSPTPPKRTNAGTSLKGIPPPGR